MYRMLRRHIRIIFSLKGHQHSGVKKTLDYIYCGDLFMFIVYHTDRV